MFAFPRLAPAERETDAESVLEDVRRKQMYLPDTNVLLTRFLSPHGVGEVSDFMQVNGGGPAHRVAGVDTTRAIGRVTPATLARGADDARMRDGSALLLSAEAVGIASGAWMGGMKSAVLMQTSGFATLANVLASLAVPYQIPLIMFVSERGTLGEFNYGQSLVCRTMRPVLDSLALEHHTITRLDELEFIADRSIKQAVTTQAPVALILNPLLTGGKVFDK